MANEGSVLIHNSPLDLFLNMLAIPGMFPFYVVGTLTNSVVLGHLAFVIGMGVTYGGLGLTIDLCRRATRTG